MPVDVCVPGFAPERKHVEPFALDYPLNGDAKSPNETLKLRYSASLKSVIAPSR
jgi:hypothetical protein